MSGKSYTERARALRPYIEQASESLPDSDAAKAVEMFPRWADHIGETVKPGDRRSDMDISTHAPLAGRDSKSVQITMHIFAITDKFQMLLHRMPPVRAFCSFLMQENHADFGCEPPK